MMDFKVNGKVVEAVLENGRTVKISTQYLERMIANLDDVKDMEDAVYVWLEEEGYLENEELEELDSKEKVKVIARKEKKEKPKTQKERVKKENPTKEFIIAEIEKVIKSFGEDVVVENKGKLITFKYNGEDFKIDLVQKRKPKEEK